VDDKTDAETGSGFRNRSLNRKIHDCGDRQNVNAGKIAEARDECIGKSETNTVVIGGLAEQEQRQDG
jgi:hypothetical protein